MLMLPSLSDKQATRAEIGFEEFPCGPCATDADRALRSLAGVIQVLFDPCVRRALVLFDPARVNLSHILSTLQPFATKPKVTSVISPWKGVVRGKNSDF